MKKKMVSLKKDELLVIVKDALMLESKKEAEGFLKEVDAVVEALANKLKSQEKVKVGNYFTVEKVHVDEKEGKCNGTPYNTPEHDEMTIKRANALKELVR